LACGPRTWRSDEDVPIFRQDLGSLMDLNLIHYFAKPPYGRVTRILEVGGGYGRLAEAAFNVFVTPSSSDDRFSSGKPLLCQ